MWKGRVRCCTSGSQISNWCSSKKELKGHRFINAASMKFNVNWFSLSYGIGESSSGILCLFLISAFSEHVAALGAEKGSSS